MRKILSAGLLSLLVLALSASVALAGITKPESGNLPNQQPNTLLEGVFDVVAGIAGLITALMIVIGGIMWMVSGGDEEKAGNARKMMIAGVVGLVIVGAAVGFVRFAVDKLGF